MKQNAIYMLKALLFSALIFALATLLLAFLMMKTGWGDSVMFPMLIVFFCLAAFLGGRYFAKHAETRRFLWGIGFGAAGNRADCCGSGSGGGGTPRLFRDPG